MQVVKMMGGELGRMRLEGLVATDDRARRLGREAGNSDIFHFRPVSFKIGAVAEIATALTEALVLFLFGGVSIFVASFF